MSLFSSIKDSFTQLTDAIDRVSTSEYVFPSAMLSGATIGQHTRHIIELYQCLLNGYEAGAVCYDHRKRDVLIETDKELAKKLLVNIAAQTNLPNKELQLTAVYGDSTAEQLVVSTNYYRELAYNLEHTIHHMALIKAGLKELNKAGVSETFGVASSTTRHRNQS
ncbi:MAG: DinB family protein [Chitinophagaceae bacterium]|nr:DinB family protein [Chitinophagaceae bacterium]